MKQERTWSSRQIDPEDSKSPYSASLLVDDQPVATAARIGAGIAVYEGPDWISAWRNLMRALQQKGIPPDGPVLKWSALRRVARRRP